VKSIVASLPRCGSTMVWRAVVGIGPDEPALPQHYAAVPKLHAMTPEARRLLRRGARAVFLFGDPIAAVLSTLANCYNMAHFRNCGCNDTEPDIIDADGLGYEQIFNAWTRARGEVLLLRYETLPRHAWILSEFLEREILLPPWRARETNVDRAPPERVAAIRTTYARLIRKVQNMPNVLLRTKSGKGGECHA